jgi:hypothetical protein
MAQWKIDDDYQVYIANCIPKKICDKLSRLFADKIALFQVELEVNR